jgi:hypothetical protein
VKLPGIAAAALLAAGLIATPGQTEAAPTKAAPDNTTTTREFGNGPERNEIAATLPEAAAPNALSTATPATKPKTHGYPRQNDCANTRKTRPTSRSSSG